MPSSLSAVLNDQVLRRLAGSSTYGRGDDYFKWGKIHSLVQEDGAVSARVDSTKKYAVKLWVDGKNLGYSCNCPAADDGDTCKHVVAVGLAVLVGTIKPPEPPKPKTTLVDVRAFLEAADKNTLVETLMDWAVWDDALRDQLFLKAAKSKVRTSKGLDIDAVKEAIDLAIDTGGDYVDWRGAGDYARGVGGAVDTLEELLKDGHAVEAIGLCEHALKVIEDALAHSVDDSGGHMGEHISRLQEVHHAACLKAKPDPVELAARLFKWELNGGFDTFFGAVTTYSDVLGKVGVAEYRRLAESEWKELPVIAPGQNDPERYRGRFRLDSIMQAIAKQDGDLDALIRVMSRDLGSGYQFLRIAEVCKKAGKVDLAIEWAERGVKSFTEDKVDGRLREFLAGAYTELGRHDDSIDQAWLLYAARPLLETYKTLKKQADTPGQWAIWREKAQAFIRTELDPRGAANAGKPHWQRTRDKSELVEILLWEGENETAWTEAQTGGCNQGLWLQLAETRIEAHPGDAVLIYQQQVGETLRRADKRAYSTAIHFLKKVHSVMKRMGKSDEFNRYLATIRAENARRPNFTKLVDRARWS